MARSCFCMDPACGDCFPQNDEEASSSFCSCLQPDCAVCRAPNSKARWGQLWASDERRGATFICGRGSPLPVTAARLVHNVHVMLEALIEDGVLEKGPRWHEMPHESRKKTGDGRNVRGSIYENVLSRLTHVPVATVSAVVLTASGPGGAKLLAAPKPAGRKKSNAEAGAVVAAPDAIPKVSGVEPEDAKIGVILARAALDAAMHATDTQYQRTVLQLFQAGVDVGHKHHDRHAPRAIAHAAVGLLREEVRLLLKAHPHNLKCHKLSPLWSLECDSVPCQTCGFEWSYISSCF